MILQGALELTQTLWTAQNWHSMTFAPLLYQCHWMQVAHGKKKFFSGCQRNHASKDPQILAEILWKACHKGFWTWGLKNPYWYMNCVYITFGVWFLRCNWRGYIILLFYFKYYCFNNFKRNKSQNNISNNISIPWNMLTLFFSPPIKTVYSSFSKCIYHNTFWRNIKILTN